MPQKLRLSTFPLPIQKTTQAFKSTAQDYIQTAQMAEEYLQVFIDLMYLVDDQLSQSEQESQHMMNRISL